MTQEEQILANPPQVCATCKHYTYTTDRDEPYLPEGVCTYPVPTWAAGGAREMTPMHVNCPAHAGWKSRLTAAMKRGPHHVSALFGRMQMEGEV